jgi:hypothetical protein
MTPLLAVQGVTSVALSSNPGLINSWVSTQDEAAVVVVDSTWAVVVESASAVVVVTSSEAIVVSDVIVDKVSARLISAVVAVDSTWMVVEASVRVVSVVESKVVAVESDAIVDELSAMLVTPVVEGRQGPASTPKRNRVTAAAGRTEKRTILTQRKGLVKRVDTTADNAVDSMNVNGEKLQSGIKVRNMQQMPPF